jgi:adenine-specific DNA-methyltransferase
MPTLNWIGKEVVVNYDQQVPFHLLKDVPELSCGQPGNGNLIIEGDNLVALKALLPYYAGQVKCIYIDPPYNTGNENWVYNDNVNSPVIQEWLGKVVGGEGETLDRHDRWLCMIYPRLQLLKKFLNTNGSIWISIDDSEMALLRTIMDEIFGRKKFIACIAWQKRYSRENRQAIGDVHEYILIYALNPERFKMIRNRVPPTEKQAKIYKNPNNDPRGRWRPIPISAQAGHATPEQFYEITAPSGKVFKPSKGRCWGLAETTFKQLLKEGRIYFGKKGNSQPNIIRYLSEVEGMVPWTWWPYEDVGHTDEASKELLNIFGGTTEFDTTPKPSRLIERILQIATNPGDIILDSFAGSGTTGHSTLRLNSFSPEKEPRKFVLIEMETKIAREVTSERVRRVASGYNDLKGNYNKGFGGGFRYCELDEPLFNESGKIRETVSFTDLARHVYFCETGEPLPGDGLFKTPFLGAYNGTGIYLLYNGILKDKSVNGGNVLNRAILAQLPPFEGQKIIYCAGCLLGKDRLQKERIIIRQTPYEVKAA